MEDDTTVLQVAPRRAAQRISQRQRATRIGPYQLLEQIASGGMGEVYAGQHRFLGRKVAIKILHEQFERDPSVLDRFHAEAQATARIRHPGIVQVYDYGFSSDGRTFMVTELLEGQTLAERMSAGAMPLPTVIEIARQLASTLAAVHGHGIIHRDVKPENIYLSSDPVSQFGIRVKLLDFGLSRPLSPRARELTSHGTILGTPLYMAPEQWRSDAVDHRADIYALGCLLYEMACGVLPFTGHRMSDLCDSHCGYAPTPPREIDARIPLWLERLILRMIAKSAGQRPGSMRNVERELRGPDPADPPVIEAEGSCPGLTLPVAARVPRRRRLVVLLAFAFAAAAGIALGTVLSPWLT